MGRKKKMAEIIPFPTGFGKKQKPNIKIDCPYGKIIPFKRFEDAAKYKDMPPALVIYTDREAAKRGWLEAALCNEEIYIPTNKKWAIETYGHAKNYSK